MNQPITIFPDEEMAEKFKQGRESLGMSEEEYFVHLMELSDESEYAENEDEEPEEQGEEPEEEQDEELSEILAGITDVSDKNAIIKELKIQIKIRDEEVSNLTEELDKVTNYPRFNLIFNLVRGHTLRISDSEHEVTIREKKDLVQCLIKNFHWTIDSEDFGIDSDEFEKMEEEAFKTEKGKEESKDEDQPYEDEE